MHSSTVRGQGRAIQAGRGGHDVTDDARAIERSTREAFGRAMELALPLLDAPDVTAPTFVHRLNLYNHEAGCLYLYLYQ